MCAQCNNKKDHIHTSKSTVANKATVTVVAAATDCCSSVTADCCSSNKDSEGGMIMILKAPQPVVVVQPRQKMLSIQ